MKSRLERLQPRTLGSTGRLDLIIAIAVNRVAATGTYMSWALVTQRGGR
jgi:hypothetical protein